MGLRTALENPSLNDIQILSASPSASPTLLLASLALPLVAVDCAITLASGFVAGAVSGGGVGR